MKDSIGDYIAWSVADGQLYDKFASRYDSEYLGPIEKAEDSVIRAALSTLVQEAMVVMDVGCGTGRFLDWFPLDRTRYMGIDPSGKMLDIARAKWPTHWFSQRKAEALSRSDGAVNLAVALWSLGHCDAEPALNGIRVTMAKGGKLFFVTYRNWRPTLVQSDGDAVRTIRYWKASDWRRLLTNAGFGNIKVSGLSSRLARAMPPWYVKLEAATILKLVPDWGDYVMVTAEAS